MIQLRRLLTLLLVCTSFVATPARAAYVNFESGQVRPLALSPSGARLFAVNTPDARLEIFDVRDDGLVHAGAVAVGLEPVAVAARTETEVWVVNHLSDSVSVVDLAGDAPRVVATLLVGDEPRDVVFAGPARTRAFVTAAHRGQNRPGDPQLTTPGVGRADVWVFDALDRGAAPGGTPLGIVTLFGDTPRALAVSPDGRRVYAAVFLSGNETTVVAEDVVCDGGAVAPPCMIDGATMPGGLPSPNDDAGGVRGPETGLVVKYEWASQHWLDGLGRDWSGGVRFSLPDLDVFAIGADSLEVERSWAHVGTVLFGLAVDPQSGRVYVANTEARNDLRFEGPGIRGGSTVRGRAHESRITVLDGDDVRPHHLNPHIDYDTVPAPDGVAERSLSTPVAVATSSDGATLYVAAFGSAKVGILSTAALDAGALVPDAADHVTLAGGGPSGLVLDEARGRLYVLTRFDDAVSVIDLATRRETQHLALFSPEPASVVEGRPLLYDARATSSNGEASCASCHVFGDLDGLGWDLGDPDARVAPNPNEIHFGDYQDFHPLKGPMTTQSLRGLAGHGPMHWRGDRTGGSRPGGDSHDEAQAFLQFNVAFPGLLGRASELPEGDMTRLMRFALQIAYPPNPIRALDRSLTPAQERGRDLYFGRKTDGDFNCLGCHALAPSVGLFGSDRDLALQGGPQLFKIPHLRNLYQKVGMFGRPATARVPGAGADTGAQVRGFGFQHDGSVDTLARFHATSVFTMSAAERADMEQFLLAYDSNSAPIVGQQVTLAGADAAALARLELLLARARAGECDLAAKGILDGASRGWLLDADGSFRSDRASEPRARVAQFQAQAQVAGQELTFTCVPSGSGARVALDRDQDGVADRDEIDAGTDPADPRDAPPVPTPTPVPEQDPVRVRTSALRLRQKLHGPDRKWLRFTSRTAGDPAPSRVVAPAAGGIADPTRGGGALIVYGAGGTTDATTYALPASGWRRLGTALRAGGFVYRGGTGDPIRSVVVRDDEIVVRGDGAYTLDEPRQRTVAVRLRLGAPSSGTAWCAAAPAQQRGERRSTRGTDRPGRFIAEPDSPAPAACPAVP
ncbi:hypothetical protein K2Z84_01845 [Candidatus Binatia bacterium]|nr:hypothetical protein [Candidatus Binatia bacterium]